MPSAAAAYFNYFTQIEDKFLKHSGQMFLETLDWAQMEAWEDDGVPLEAILGGIEDAFAVGNWLYLRSCAPYIKNRLKL